MTSLIAKLALAFATAWTYGEASAACAVMPGQGTERPLTAVVNSAMEHSVAVFLGEVTAIDYLPAPDATMADREVQVVRLAARSWWKGDESKVVTLRTLNGRNRLGQKSMEAHEYQYEVGKTYLVYAYQSDDGLHANICTRTRRASEAADDIAALNALKTASGRTVN